MVMSRRERWAAGAAFVGALLAVGTYAALFLVAACTGL